MWLGLAGACELQLLTLCFRLAAVCSDQGRATTHTCKQTQDSHPLCSVATCSSKGACSRLHYRCYMLPSQS
jgi:hypothetical protein